MQYAAVVNLNLPSAVEDALSDVVRRATMVGEHAGFLNPADRVSLAKLAVAAHEASKAGRGEVLPTGDLRTACTTAGVHDAATDQICSDYNAATDALRLTDLGGIAHGVYAP
ncbi:hypothetical protein HN371_17885 [Candidatus Poribacteria bacterium]|nr:hypothetical protein [Candidatus Poribacteria bacterium]MBT7808127.1 hypothetical protein [Candidatus Poribacteria bacterium]